MGLFPAAIFSAILAGLAYYLFQFVLVIVPAKRIALVERMGLYNRTLYPGIHWLVPVLESIREVDWSYRGQDNRLVRVHHRLVPFDTLQMDVPLITCTTKDQVAIEVDLSIFYTISNLRYAVYASEDALAYFYQSVTQATRETISKINVTGTYGMENAISASILESINATVKDTYGLTCNRVVVQNIIAPTAIKNIHQQLYVQKQQLEKETLAAEVEMVRYRALRNEGFNVSQIVELVRAQKGVGVALWATPTAAAQPQQ